MLIQSNGAVTTRKSEAMGKKPQTDSRKGQKEDSPDQGIGASVIIGSNRERTVLGDMLARSGGEAMAEHWGEETPSSTDERIGGEERAAISRLLSSESWTRRLEEARAERHRILASRTRQTSAPVFRPGGERSARINLLPPLEPPMPAERSRGDASGVVVYFDPPHATSRLAEARAAAALMQDMPGGADPVEEAGAPQRVEVIFGGGLLIGVAIGLGLALIL